MQRVPGILTTLAGMSDGMSLKIMAGTRMKHTSATSGGGGASAVAGGGMAETTKGSGSRSGGGTSPSSSSIIRSSGTAYEGSEGVERRMHAAGIHQKGQGERKFRFEGDESGGEGGGGEVEEEEEEKCLEYLESDLHLKRITSIQSLGAGCIATIATVKQMAGAILKNGIVVILLKLLFSPGEEARECRECAASALCLFAQGSSDGREEIVQRGGVKCLLDVLAPITAENRKETREEKEKGQYAHI